MAAFSTLSSSVSNRSVLLARRELSACQSQATANHAAGRFSQASIPVVTIRSDGKAQLRTAFTQGARDRRFFGQRVGALNNRNNVSSHSGSASGGALSTEANIFARTARIFRAFIGGVVSSNEDPERLLEQATEEMGNDLAKLRQTSAQVVASKRILESKYNQAQTASSEWYRRAKKALEKGDEMLAKEALKRKKIYDDSSKALGSQLAQQTQVVERMLSSAQLLESKINEARSKKDTLKARAQSAKTSKYIQELVGSIDTSSALAAYERMEEKVVRLEAEAEALGDMTEDNLATKFAMLESEDVGDDLDALKREMGFSKPIRGELPIANWAVEFEKSKEEMAKPYNRY